MKQHGGGDRCNDGTGDNHRIDCLSGPASLVNRTVLAVQLKKIRPITAAQFQYFHSAGNYSCECVKTIVTITSFTFHQTEPYVHHQMIESPAGDIDISVPRVYPHTD